MDKMEKIKVEFQSYSFNESFARSVVAAFIARLDPTIEELEDIKTAVSEAVTNCVLHGYENTVGIICIEVELNKKKHIKVLVHDDGVGIPDIELAMQPLYTSKSSAERSGMGFSFMEAFMDEVEVISEVGVGTTVIMRKTLGVNRFEE